MPQESDFQGLEGAYIRFFCYNFVAAFYKRMEKKKKILFVSSEMAPFIEDSPVGAIARFLPQAIQEKNHEIRILVPRFGVINERRNRLHEVVRLSGINITIDDNDNPLIIKVASIPQTKMQVYFLDNEDVYENLGSALQERTGEAHVSSKKVKKSAEKASEKPAAKGSVARNILDDLDGDRKNDGDQE